MVRMKCCIAICGCSATSELVLRLHDVIRWRQQFGPISRLGISLQIRTRLYLALDVVSLAEEREPVVQHLLVFV